MQHWSKKPRTLFLLVPLFALMTACGGAVPAGEFCDAGTAPEGEDAGVPVDAGVVVPDLDVALARFNSDGTLDQSFGRAGVATVDFGAGSGTVRDSLWNFRIDAQGRLVLFGSRKGEGSRIDTDRVVARLTPTGALDTTFATKGFHTLNLGNLSDNARSGLVQADGRIVSAGYTSAPTGVGTQAANRVVLLRLSPDGAPDKTFGYEGVVSHNPFSPADPVATPWGMAEAYAVGLQSSGRYVTTGYGRTAPSGQVNLVSFGYTPTGAVDPTYATRGTLELDVAGDNDRGRDLTVLPDDRLFMVGSTTPAPNNVDAMVVMLTPSGAPDTTFAPEGRKVFAFGRNDEAFFGSAVSPDGRWAVAVGHRAGPVGGAPEDDDGLLAIFPLIGSGAEFAQPVPLSESADDRLVGVAFGADGKIYATGYLSERGDTRMAVVRFNTDGTRDTSFGSGGMTVVNVATAGALEAARSVTVQSDGKVIIGGIAERFDQQ